ncbi:hypothetical protein JW905_19040 [bacterium]|nr:hypothetical protein [candidate division CSSED10-310 bacterium]
MREIVLANAGSSITVVFNLVLEVGATCFFFPPWSTALEHVPIELTPGGLRGIVLDVSLPVPLIPRGGFRCLGAVFSPGFTELAGIVGSWTFNFE